MEKKADKFYKILKLSGNESFERSSNSVEEYDTGREEETPVFYENKQGEEETPLINEDEDVVSNGEEEVVKEPNDMVVVEFRERSLWSERNMNCIRV